MKIISFLNQLPKAVFFLMILFSIAILSCTKDEPEKTPPTPKEMEIMELRNGTHEMVYFDSSGTIQTTASTVNMVIQINLRHIDSIKYTIFIPEADRNVASNYNRWCWEYYTTFYYTQNSVVDSLFTSTFADGRNGYYNVQYIDPNDGFDSPLIYWYVSKSNESKIDYNHLCRRFKTYYKYRIKTVTTDTSSTKMEFIDGTSCNSSNITLPKLFKR